MALDDLVEQLENSVDSGFYFLALITALTIPDICCAISAEDGRSKGKRYASWYEEWVRPRFSERTQRSLTQRGITSAHLPELQNPLTGLACWDFRCSMLHQARMSEIRREGVQYSRIIFIEPGRHRGKIHYGTMSGALVINVSEFCGEIIDGFRLWNASKQDDDCFIRNMPHSIQRHPDGLYPYIVGVPIIG